MKGELLRQDIDRILSTREDPSKVEGMMNRLLGEQEPPINNRSVPDWLWVLWTRIKELRTETEDLSFVLREHSGSRLPQVIDLLNRAETLTSQTMRETTGQTPSQFSPECL